MSKVKRDAPRRSTASESTQALFEFEREFPDDAACLAWLLRERYPDGIFCKKCGRLTTHHRRKSRPSYECAFCGTDVHPMVGTIFQDSATSLRLWFYAMYLMASTRCGISAKQLERELGVTYKTAWRMFRQIRSLLVQDETPLSGEVEMDEAFIGGAAKWRRHGFATGVGGGSAGKAAVFGMAQRKTATTQSRLRVRVVPDVGTLSLMPHVETRVLPSSTVYTDEWRAYDGLGKKGYTHRRIRHRQKIYVSGAVHTNTIEGFWSLLRRGISGVYHGVGTRHLQSYVDEYVFRYNNRDARGGMFAAFLLRAAQRPRTVF